MAVPLAAHPGLATLAELRRIVGPGHVVAPGPDQEPFLVDWRGRYRGEALAVVMPGSTAEVSAVVRYCAAQGLPVVPQGGNTGMCGAACPVGVENAVVLRLDRMDRVLRVDPLANAATVQAGCVLANVQAAAAAAGRFFPLSLGAEGSCQIGGNISTNAGGTAVLRYGTMRELVLGLEVVLPDGTVLDGLRALRKDSSGYDLKQLFIGAEGTLGIVTAATLKLFSPPRSTALAFASLPGIEAVMDVLTGLRLRLDDRLSSLELLSRGQVELIAEHMPDVPIPLGVAAPFFLLIEVTDTMEGIDLRSPLEAALEDAMNRGLILDAVLPSSESQAASLWRLRHSVSESGRRAGVVVSHDSAVPLENQVAFVNAVERRIRQEAPGARLAMVGHVGDGNIHVIAILDPQGLGDPAEQERLIARINGVVDEETRIQGGVVSAEHGIGLSNRSRLARIGDPVKLELMRRIKAALDPACLMNPGKVLPGPTDRHASTTA